MTKKFHIVLVIMMFGFLLMPLSTFACGGQSEKKSCTEKTSKTPEKMDCCSNESHSKNKCDNGCNGKCGHSNCVTTSTQFNAVIFDIKFKNHNFDFSEIKQNYFKSNTNISSGYSSLWLIPKIG